jgi:hypothetical protein
VKATFVSFSKQYGAQNLEKYIDVIAIHWNQLILQQTALRTTEQTAVVSTNKLPKEYTLTSNQQWQEESSSLPAQQASKEDL